MLGTLVDSPKETKDERFKTTKVTRYTLLVPVGIENSTKKEDAMISCIVPGELGEFVLKKYKKDDKVTVLGEYIEGDIDTQTLNTIEGNDFIVLEQQFTYSTDGLEFVSTSIPTLNQLLAGVEPVEETKEFMNKYDEEDEDDFFVLPF